MSNAKSGALAVFTAIAGTTLGTGLAHGWVPFIAAGAALSVLSPGLPVTALVRRRWRRSS